MGLINLDLAPVSDGLGLVRSGSDNARVHAAYFAEDEAWTYDITTDSKLRWNKSYPYQLMLVLREDDGSFVVSDVPRPFTLPIPPQELHLNMPFAITTTATLSGIVEEHNGAPFRNISLSGTTGILPLRGHGDSLADKSSFGSIFGGTISAVNGVMGSINKLISTGPSNNNTNSDLNFFGSDGQLTGYYQFRLLQRFLESYAAKKKTASGANYRLAFAMHKDQAVYLVTPLSFDVKRSASSPMEYTYSLNLKAWRRIHLGEGPKPYDRAGPSLRSKNIFNTILEKISEARSILQGVSGVITAIGGDINGSLFEPVRQITYFCKDAVGVVISAIDLPASVIKDLKSTCIEATNLKRLETSLQSALSKSSDSIQEDLKDINDLGTSSSKSETGKGDLDHTSSVLSGASVANDIFNNPNEHYEILNAIRPSDLNVPPPQKEMISNETDRIRSLTRFDFEVMRDKIQDFATDFSDKVGAGSDSYNKQFGLNSTHSTRTATPDEWDAVFAMNQIVVEANRLVASGNVNGSKNVSSVDYIAGLAQASGIAFKKPVSKYAIPMPYGSTLEVVALQYLGDPQRWMEIAALNGLRSPYVDEEGFDLPFTVKGNGNQFAVADALNLYIGQQVWLSSTNTNRTIRHITKIEQVTNNWTIFVDGDSDLDRFSTMSQASLHAFLPGTCNSQQMIYIPSDAPPGEIDDNLKTIPGLNQFDPLIKVGGIDLLLTQSGDLAMTSDGDCKISVGLANIIQKVRTALSTEKGGLIHFPSYGSGISVGTSVADFDAASIRTSITNMLKGDPTFTGISGLTIKLNGPTLSIQFGVEVKGVDQTVPVSFSIKL